jgi:transposase
MKGPSETWRALARLVESLGNVCEACRRMQVSRNFYYAGMRKWGYAAEETESPAARPRKRHPHAVPAALQEEILSLIRENPEWGCDRIAYYLKLKGKAVSSPTVQKILIRHGLGRRSQRLRPFPHGPSPVRE